jgi:aminobenzoyl-glutamate utilization protein A
MDLKETILKFADDVQADMVACRRDLHAHPEPGWTEFRTAAKVAKTLAELGYTVKTGADTIREDAMMGVPSAEKLAKEQQRAIAEGADPSWVKKMDGGRTGVLGVMQFSEDGPVVAVRFDMDSNDVTETVEAAHRANKEGFASCHAGAMHACGHDGHTTVGLALARLLASLKSELRGTIKLCFQPAEEGVRTPPPAVWDGTCAGW